MKGLLLSREAAGGEAGEGEVGVGSQKVSWLRQFFEEKSFFGAIRAAEGEEGVGGGQFFAEDQSWALVKTSDGWTLDEGGAGEMDPFPKMTEGRVGIQSGGGELRNCSDDSFYEKTQKKPPFCGDWRMRRKFGG